MCLAIPGRIVRIEGETAIVDFDGIRKNVNLALVDAKVGDYIVANAGYAIKTLSNESAQESIKLFKQAAKNQ
ncbi:HypC/HybG/HupF family hydrogenase formation chaperone [Candidatus Woesearchaeota archaeon]|nr:HypC/HybG/HupF family hydrogenase formation chaperone [Candidatus Woesearchaeota archaeon]